MNTRKWLHYLTVTLSMLGIMFSFYIIGWVDATNSVAIGALCFFLFLGCMVLSTLSWVKFYNKGIETQ